MIEIQSLSCHLPTIARPLFENVSLKVQPGECTLIQGRSGGGKTTLLNCLNGVARVISGARISGFAAIDGVPILDRPLHEIGRLVGTVFQDCRSQFFMTQVTEELVFTARNYGRTDGEIQERIGWVNKIFDLEPLLPRSVFQLSSGERQRVAVASAAVYGPGILLLDEPSANLDEKGLEGLARLLRRLKEEGCAVLVADHRSHYAETLFDTRYDMTPDGLAPRTAVFGEQPSAEAWRETEDSVSPLGKPLLDVRDLSFSRGGTPLLAGVNARWRRGEIIAISGGNGTGKTTLLRLLCGLERPSGGKIVFFDGGSSSRKRRNACVLVMQDPDYQLFSDSVRKELLLGAFGMRSRQEPKSVLGDFMETVRAFGLDALLDKHPGALSMGEKQRTLIAAAFLAQKDVLLLDEPTSGMDRGRMRDLAEMIRIHARQGGLAVIVTHDEDFMAEVGACRCELRNGRFDENATTARDSLSQRDRSLSTHARRLLWS